MTSIVERLLRNVVVESVEMNLAGAHFSPHIQRFIKWCNSRSQGSIHHRAYSIHIYSHTHTLI